MTRDEIIRAAIEAGLHLYVNDLTEEPYVVIVERFAELVAAAERERCLDWCAAYTRDDGTAQKIASAIRGMK